MSGPESREAGSSAPGVRLGICISDVVELAARRGRGADLAEIAAGRGVRLPALGRAWLAADQLAIAVRPERWLLLSPPASPGAHAEAWREACAGAAAAVDLSSGLTALFLAGPALREVLARGCRLDLHPRVFPPGHAAATLVAQVSVLLAATRAGLLLLTPATTARHFCEWLACSAAPFGFDRRSPLPLSCVSGDP